MRHTAVPVSERYLLAVVLVLVTASGCGGAGGSADVCEPGTIPCDDTGQLQPPDGAPNEDVG